MTDPLWRWSATRIAAAIRNRDISAREAVDSCVARMAAVNPRLNAVTVDLSQAAQEAAQRADRAVASGEALGPLHGVPVTIKENVDQEGCATTNGVVGFQNVVARADSPIVSNWRRAGAIIIGRTNTPAFSFRLDTVNDLRGRTFSPWSKRHTPGGSSGGAASSVAAGITPLAHGNDIAGSVRFPAYACGLVGIRPSFGRVPAYNPTQAAERSLSSQLMSVQGPLARTVADARLGFVAMAARDARDPWWTPAPLEGPVVSKRVAVVTDPADLAGARLHPSVAAAIESAAQWLASAGYEIVDERTPGFSRAKELWFEMQMPEFRHFMLPLIEKEGDEGIRTAVRFKLENNPPTDPAAYMKALAERARLVRQWTQFFDGVPLVLAPISSEPVYEHGFDVESVGRTAALWCECATMTGVPVLGLPGVAVPTGIVDGLPMGVQIIGPRFREDLCLAAAQAIEAQAGALTPVDPAW
ncbi:MAG TPA: amidase family protein [Casimicrobiaceae bacterium]|nr:amidase family protein [Casimicrobiaceae bacterium]